jgi:hypothetical protein
MVGWPSPIFYHPEGAALPSEVRCGVAYLSADDYDRHIEATDVDTGSDFIFRPREDGQGSGLLIFL